MAGSDPPWSWPRPHAPRIRQTTKKRTTQHKTAKNRLMFVPMQLWSRIKAQIRGFPEDHTSSTPSNAFPRRMTSASWSGSSRITPRPPERWKFVLIIKPILLTSQHLSVLSSWCDGTLNPFALQTRWPVWLRTDSGCGENALRPSNQTDLVFSWPRFSWYAVTRMIRMHFQREWVTRMLRECNVVLRQTSYLPTAYMLYSIPQCASTRVHKNIDGH